MDECGGKTPITPEEILASELYGTLVKAKGETERLSNPAILQKLRAAEDYYEHELQIFFQRRRVKSDPTDRPGGAADADSWDVEEPAYEYPRDFFMGDRWGYFDLRYRPVTSVDQIYFAYPGAAAKAINFAQWVRLDKQFGRVQLVPAVGAAHGTFELNTWFAGVLGGGSGIPHALYVDYTAGFDRTTLLRDHQDLLEGVRLRATLLLYGILSNARTRGLGSQSLSEDGLSRSQSPIQGKYGPYGAAVQLAIDNETAILDSWRRAMLGVPFVVV